MTDCLSVTIDDVIDCCVLFTDVYCESVMCGFGSMMSSFGSTEMETDAVEQFGKAFESASLRDGNSKRASCL